MIYGPGTWISDFSLLFPHFARADLELWGYGWSHRELHLAATLPEGEKADLCFLGTCFLDCPVQMRNARLRLPTAEENAGLETQLPSGVTEFLFDRTFEPLGWGLPADHCHLIIESDAGLHRVIADGFFLQWGAEPKRRFLDETVEHLWPGGPPLGEL